MARVELSETALAALARMMATHSLPADTPVRVSRSLRALERFPLLGASLAGRWQGFRFVLGPWRWMILVYVFLEEDDRVVVVTIEDARSAAAARPRS